MATVDATPSEVITDLEIRLQAVTQQLTDLTSNQSQLTTELKDLEKSLSGARKTVAQFGQTVDATEDGQTSAENYVKAMTKKLDDGPDKKLEKKVTEVTKNIEANITSKATNLSNKIKEKDDQTKLREAAQSKADKADKALADLGTLSDARKNAQGELESLKKQFEDMLTGGYKASALFLLREMGKLLKSDACAKTKEQFRKDMDGSWQTRRDAQSKLADATAEEKAAEDEVQKAQKALNDAQSKRQASIIAYLKTSGTSAAENTAP